MRLRQHGLTAAIVLSLGTLTACGGGGNTRPTESDASTVLPFAPAPAPSSPAPAPPVSAPVTPAPPVVAPPTVPPAPPISGPEPPAPPVTAPPVTPPAPPISGPPSTPVPPAPPVSGPPSTPVPPAPPISNPPPPPSGPASGAPPSDPPATPPPADPPVTAPPATPPPADPPATPPPADPPVTAPPAIPPPLPPPPSPLPPLTAPSPLYRVHLDPTGVSTVQAQGITGQGMKIGVIDSGAYAENPALLNQFAYMADYTGVTPVGSNIPGSAVPITPGMEDPAGHGSITSQILAGQATGYFQGGVAPSASLYMAQVTHASDGSGINVMDALAAMEDLSANKGVHIFNNSWNSSATTIPAFSDNSSTGNFNARMSALVQAGNLVVWAAGNNSSTFSGALSRTPIYDPATAAGWLNVVALDSNNLSQLASYSNQCGDTATWCLAAPGSVVVVSPTATVNDTSYTMVEGSGTSFAAPQVTASAALVWEKYPWMTNDLVRQTLLTTATDLGAPGVDSVFGYGMLNTAKAINGPGSFDFGDVTANVTPGTYTWSNDIGGQGGLIKTGAGTLVLSGNNTYAGNTTINGGVLEVDGKTASNTYTTINAGGVLTGQGHVYQVNNYGTLYNTGAGLYIDNWYNQDPSATLATQVGSVLHVTGLAIINGTLMITGIRDGYVPSTTTKETILTAMLVSGSFAQTTTASGVFLDADTVYTPTTVGLNIRRIDVSNVASAMNASSLASAGTHVEGALEVADAMSAGTTTSNTSFLNGAAALESTGSLADAKMALSSLSGEVYPNSLEIARLNSLDAARTLREQALAHQDGDSSVWGATDHREGTWNDEAGQAKFQTDGFHLGLQRNIDQAGFVGVMFSQQTNHWDDQSQGTAWGKSKNSAYDASVFGGISFDGFNLTGHAGYGYYHTQVDRPLVLGYTTWYTGSNVSGHTASAGLGLSRSWGGARDTWTPEVGVEALRISQQGFTERDATAFELNGQASTNTSVTAHVGLSWTHSFEVAGGQGLFGLHGMYEQWLTGQNPSIAAYYSGASTNVFDLTGWQAPSHRTTLGADVVYPLTHKIQLNFGYAYDWAGNMHGSRVNVGLRMAF